MSEGENRRCPKHTTGPSRLPSGGITAGRCAKEEGHPGDCGWSLKPRSSDARDHEDCEVKCSSGCDAESVLRPSDAQPLGSPTPPFVFTRNARGGLEDHPAECVCGPCNRVRAFDANPFKVGEPVEAPEYARPGKVAIVRGYEASGRALISWTDRPDVPVNYWPCHLQRVTRTETPRHESGLRCCAACETCLSEEHTGLCCSRCADNLQRYGLSVVPVRPTATVAPGSVTLSADDYSFLLACAGMIPEELGQRRPTAEDRPEECEHCEHFGDLLRSYGEDTSALKAEIKALRRESPTAVENGVVAYVDELTGGLSAPAEAKLRALLRGR